VDSIRITDTGTGELATATFEVDPDASLDVHGGLWLIPLGGAITPAADGGTGHLDVVLEDGDVLLLDDDRVLGQSAGEADLVVSDRFTGQYQAVRVIVADPHAPESNRGGTEGRKGAALGGFDWTGDGIADAVVSSPKDHLAGSGTGGVFVFAGGPTGLEAEPFWQWPSEADSGAGYGSDLAGGDVDGDGIADLVVGAATDSEGLENSGTVSLFFGADGLNQEPDQYVAGATEEDYHLGQAVALCDLNADGYDDLLAVAPNANAFVDDDGALVAFPGGTLGFDDSKRTIRGGVRLIDGDWVSTVKMNQGDALAAADLDGDGFCDAAVSSTAEGTVTVYLGTSDDLLSSYPAFELVGEADNLFGYALELGELPGTGMALAVGAPGRNQPGELLFFADGALLTGEASYTTDAASIVLSGDQTNDALGFALAWNQDGWLLGIDADSGGTGAIAWVDGAALTPGEYTLDEIGERLFLGENFRDRMGAAVAIVGERLVAWAPGVDTYGQDVGGVYATNSDGVLDLLKYPGLAVDRGIGQAATLLDVNGDGMAELVLGAAWDRQFADPGQLWTCEQGCDGAFDVLALDWLPDGEDHGVYGIAMGRGDYLGDGRDELVVLARNTDRPAAYDDFVSSDGSCRGSLNDSGAVYVLPLDEPSVPVSVIYGQEGNTAPDRLLTGFDFNGDGRQDIAFGSKQGGEDKGVVYIALGRGLGNGTYHLCPDYTLVGSESGEALGDSLAVMGDLDGDGCDEIAVGSPDARYGVNGQGGVRIIWGGGPKCAADAASSPLLVAELENGHLGVGLAGGVDLDGDGLPDLVIGAPDFRPFNDEWTGVVWMVSGAWLVGLDRLTLDGPEVPSKDELAPAVLTVSPNSLWRPELGGARAGRGLAILEDPEEPGRPLVFISHDNSIPESGGYGGGWILGYDVDAGAWETVPIALLAGEPSGEGDLGQYVWWHDSTLVVGAPLSDSVRPDGGAVYRFSLGGL
jgi:hypothetical protein